MLAGQHVGIPTAHLSPVYSLVSCDFGKLRHALNLLTPGLVFVSDGERYKRAVETVVNPDTELVVTTNPATNRKSTLFSELAATNPRPRWKPRMKKSSPTTSPKFFSPPAAPACPKASSIRTA